MRVVHFGHACVLVETGTTRLLIDPGTFSSGFEQVTDVDAVLVTHQHLDHLDLDRLPAVLAANPGAQLITDSGSAGQVGSLARVAAPGDVFKVNDTEIRVVGGDHAVIHPDIPVIPNAGYVINDGAFYHPGDSLFVPDEDVDVLGLPTGAPWLKASEAVEFMRSVSPRVAVPIHEAVLARPAMIYGLFEKLKPEGTSVRPLTPGEETEV